ncbi:MAG: hypothetical protein E7481_09970 [Ruminococcaceae bacterium]|nr:hypothetical protein [Oscillospiraceae bacterium]
MSLIWSENDNRKSFTDLSFFDSLWIKNMFEDCFVRNFGSSGFELSEFLTLNKDTIKIRNEVFIDLINNRKILPELKEIVQILVDIQQLSYRDEDLDIESELYIVKELNMYTDVIKRFHEMFSVAKFTSEPLKRFVSDVESVYDSDDFKTLCDKSEKLGNKINNIKSITIGVNLDAQLRPIEAGLVSVNDENYISGNVIDKILRLDLGPSVYECIAPLEPINRNLSTQQKQVFTRTVNSSLHGVFSKSLNSWRDAIRKYLKTETSWLTNIISEFRFLVGSTEFLLKLSDLNYPLCIAEFSETEHIKDMYDPGLVLNSDGYRAVLNDLDFDRESRMYVLTGPNKGGKSVYLMAVGRMYTLLHLGLLLPAKRAEINTVDHIFIHFPLKNNMTYGKSRFEEECAQISDINKKISSNSLFLFDESLSGTNSVESVYIAKEIFSAYAVIGCKGIFSTHLHDMCNVAPDINSSPDVVSRIGNLSALLDPITKERTFKVIKGDSYGKSFAHDIAVKYNLTKEHILSAKE